MTDAPAPPPGRAASAAPRWMRWLLVASLALNLLILGLVAGEALHDRGVGGPGRGHPRPADLALGPVASALAPADKAAILSDIRERPELAAFARQSRETAFAEVAAALRADPFEPGALEATLDDQLAQVHGAEAVVREAVVARISAMSPADRAAFADRLEDAARRGPDRD